MSPATILEVLHNFRLEGEIKKIIPFGNGHINNSYRLINKNENRTDYLLQAINHHIFKRVDLLMENITLLTTFLQKKYEAISDFESLILIPSVHDQSYYRATDGSYWRIYIFKKHLQSFDLPQNRQQVFNAAVGFSRFLSDLEDFPVEKLHYTLPHFHSISYRWQLFRAALKEDKYNRNQSCPEVCDFVMAHYEAMSAIEKAEQKGLFRLRVTHNDPKFNNILLDQNGYAKCVVDLDTVMPGCILYDYGDGLRTTMTSAAEDETDLSKITINKSYIQAFTKGYLSQIAHLLNEQEKAYLPKAIPLLPFIIGMRFLTDFLAGDAYFKTAYPEHNLVRARAQLHLSRLAMDFI